MDGGVLIENYIDGFEEGGGGGVGAEEFLVVLKRRSHRLGEFELIKRWLLL